MRLVKGIGLFLIYPLLLLGLGFYAGVKTTHFFYPGEQDQGNGIFPGAGNDLANPNFAEQNPAPESYTGDGTESGNTEGVHSNDTSNDMVEAAFMGDTLCVDTEYIVEEMDVLNRTLVQSSLHLPSMYVGMNREQFLDAMDTYEVSPPLSELELGFVDLEVVSFSRERVVVRKNYRHVQPSDSFYLGVYDNEVVVFLEDRETVYIETEIRLDSLSEELQAKIIGMMWVENEEKLYSLLENYSS